MEREKILFVWNLFDAFNYIGVEKISPNLFSRRDVAEKTGVWFNENFPQEYLEIKSLFTKRIISGDYSNFEMYMREVNQTRENIRGFIDRPEKMYINLAKKFCEIAEL